MVLAGNLDTINSLVLLVGSSHNCSWNKKKNMIMMNIEYNQLSTINYKYYFIN